MVYMFLADGFEEIEALCPLDLMRRAGIGVKTVGVTGMTVTGSHSIEVKADIDLNTAFEECSFESPDMVILPGGMPGTLNLKNSPLVMQIVKNAYKADKYIASICAAPSIPGELGMLSGKEAVCFPGFEEKLSGAVISQKKVVTDGKMITAKGMGVALEFGLEIIKALISGEKAEQIKASVQA